MLCHCIGIDGFNKEEDLEAEKQLSRKMTAAQQHNHQAGRKKGLDDLMFQGTTISDISHLDNSKLEYPPLMQSFNKASNLLTTKASPFQVLSHIKNIHFYLICMIESMTI